MPGNRRHRTFWPRFWAGWIDGLVFSPILLADQFLSAPERGAAVVILWELFLSAVGILYSVLLHARYGKTVGKRVAGVTVLDISETRTPSLKQAALRDIGTIVINFCLVAWFVYVLLTGRNPREVMGPDTLGGQLLFTASFSWFLLEMLTMLTNDKRRALHDYIAGTVVVRDPS